MDGRTVRTLIDEILEALKAIRKLLKPNELVPQRIPVRGKEKNRSKSKNG